MTTAGNPAAGAAFSPAQQARRDHPMQGRHAMRVVARAQADVAIVEADAAETLLHKGVEQRLRPGRALHAEAHDQQQRRPGIRSMHGVIDLDAATLQSIRQRHLNLPRAR